ncbi:MAG: PEP/pyruvate-binding domain-containing protein [Tenuifilaceae bacterium]|jgi:pyruvate,orthophosphate dikinase|nr:PEP/pyruvate-binding domain-containing protein [Tenuifilaceae bacterium]
MEKQFESKALEANLQQTSDVNIVIPREHVWLVSLSHEQFGLNQRVSEFIRELNHPYHNLDYLCNNLKKVAISDFWFYSQQSDHTRAFNVFLAIFDDLTQEATSSNNIDILLQSLASYLELLLKEHPELIDIQAKGIAILKNAYALHKDHVIANANSLRKRLAAQGNHSSLGDEVFNLFRTIAIDTISQWQNASDIDKWAMDDLRFFPDDNILVVKRVGAKFYSQLKRQVTQAKSWDELVDKVALFSDIADYHRQLITQFDSPISQFHYIIYLLRMPNMEHQKEYLIWDMNRLLTGILNDVPNHEIGDFVNGIFRVFESLLQDHRSVVLDCIATMGKEFALFFSKPLLTQFEGHVMRIGYTPPGKTYMSSDWQLRVDPNHLKSLRVWLGLIEVAPQRFERLLSALIVNLKLGGVLIFDTDLFQRNVSNLLNADIEAIYKPVKELCRLFPVFFKEIGAEGDLRDVSTQLDTLSNRQDKLMHFLRKQIHVDGNSTHLNFLEKTLAFWANNDFTQVEPILPPDLKDVVKKADSWNTPMHKLVLKVSKAIGAPPEALLDLSLQELDSTLNQIEDIESLHKTKLKHFIKVAYLLKEKYFADAIDVVQEMRLCSCLDNERIDLFIAAEKQGDCVAMLSIIFECMANLNKVVTSRTKTEGWESIYYKRHVAFGIPSMYGQYHEPKFEALGHIFKLEKAASKIVRQVVEQVNLSYITASSLRDIVEVLELFHQGLMLDGISSPSFDSNLSMLRYSLSSYSFSLNQYINIFQFIGDSVKEIIGSAFYARFDGILKEIIPQYLSDEEKDNLQISIHKRSESFYRDMLSGSFLLQDLDSFVAAVLTSLNSMGQLYSDQNLKNIMDIDVKLLITSFQEKGDKADNRVFLGSKGFFLKSLYNSSFPVPPGFILTTEFFRRYDTIKSYNPIKQDYQSTVTKYLAQVEQLTQKRFADPQNPLLLSVRSGAAISMPGAMNTFLNVGMNDDIARALSQAKNMGWTAWDCYRRFLQTWGQAYGIERTAFDEIMHRHQGEKETTVKEQFDAHQMEQIALECKELLGIRGVPFFNDPEEQLFAAIESVLDSWDGPRAQLYRKHLQIADEWGTAVIIQSMVFGNLHRTSGTGVVFTNDLSVDNPGVTLNGEYSLLSQGEDVVGGVTNVLPISEHQERDRKWDKHKSLQAKLPRTYQRLFHLADQLVNKMQLGHQEIEFTFESDNPYDLYILQTRDQQIYTPEATIHYQSPPPKSKLLGKGIPIGASILNGVLVFDMDDLNRQKELNPDGHFVYASADTTPDDLPIIFQCHGLVTSRGGATSHAAVTAGRLGKICVVNCTDLFMLHDEGRCRFGKFDLAPGDAISLDAHTGSVYLGHFPLQQP